MIRVLEWREAAFLILLVLGTGAAIDAISRRLRAAIMGVRGAEDDRRGGLRHRQAAR
jgi:hypothetical protein